MPETALAVEALSYAYEDGTAALDGVSFAVPDGGTVGLIGHNGSGKSTLLMHTIGILPADGQVSVYGIPVDDDHLTTIRRDVGYVFQDPRDQLFMSSVLEDVAFGPLNAGMSRGEALETARNALTSVGLQGYGHRIPYHLSGGEMRRAAIATVLSMSPRLLVMDEPTAGLDPRGKRELARTVASLGCTKFIASHDLDFIRKTVTRVLVISGGRIVADGDVEAILNDAPLLERYGL